jgi:hypothetical protein
MNVNEIWKFKLRRGNSANPREGACLLDAVSWLEYGTLGDHPACVCPVIAAFGRGINDAMSDEGRQRLKLFIPRLVGTVDPEHERERAEYLAWQAIRVFAPLALDAVGQHKHATVLRNFTGSLAEAAWAAGAAAEAAAWAAWAAAGAAGAAAEAAWAAAEDAMIAALEGVLAIGRQAEPVEPARFDAAVRLFEEARG